MITNGVKPQFELSTETRLLTERLSQANVGDIVTYADMSELVGQDVRGKNCRGKLQSARERILANMGYVFAPTADHTGLKRLDDHEKVDLLAAGTDAIHRKARRLVKRAVTIQVSELTDAERMQFHTRISLIGVLHHATGTRALKQLSRVVEQAKAELPLTKTLEAFK